MNKGRGIALPKAERWQVNRIGRLAIGCVAAIAIIGGPVAQAEASISPAPVTLSRAQNVDWLSPETASSLDLGFPVLIPGGVPSPFGGEPSVSAAGGYYSLYWMNVAADPTFLQITGQVGGGLPAGSPYDLNNQLFVNASVQGYEAIHDVTPIYDQVWWIADGVLYSVASKNLDGSDSLSIANSLFALEAPSAPVETPEPTAETPTDPTKVAAPSDPTEVAAPTEVAVQPSIFAQQSAKAGDIVAITVGDAVNVNLNADGGLFSDTGETAIFNINGGSYNWQAPAVSEKTNFTLSVTSPDTGATLASMQISVSPSGNSSTGQAQSSSTVEATSTAPAASNTQDATSTAPAAPNTQDPTSTLTTSNGNSPATLASDITPVSTSVATVPSSSGSDLLSDGTDGPPPPVIGGDGTGGILVVELPRNSSAGPQP